MSQARTGYIVSPQAATSFAFGYLGLNCLNSFPPKPKESIDIKISNLIPTSHPTKQLWSQLCHGDMHNYQITGNVSSKLPPKKSKTGEPMSHTPRLTFLHQGAFQTYQFSKGTTSTGCFTTNFIKMILVICPHLMRLGAKLYLILCCNVFGIFDYVESII